MKMTIQEIELRLSNELRELLYLEPSELDDKTPFLSLGLDSIMGVELIKSLNKSFGLDLKAINLYNYPTIAALSAYLFECLNTVKNEELIAIKTVLNSSIPLFKTVLTVGDLAANGQASFFFQLSLSDASLHDHLVFNQPILPTGSYVELIASAFKEQFNIESFQLKNIKITQPLIVINNEIKIVKLELKELTDGQLRFIICSNTANNKTEIIHIKGFIEFELTENSTLLFKKNSAQKNIAIEELKKIIPQINLKGIYEGIVTDFNYNEKQAQAVINLNQPVHQSYIDQALNGGLFCAMTFGPFSLNKKEKVDNNIAFIPYEIDKITVHHHAASQVYNCLVNVEKIDLTTMTLSFGLIDEAENVLLQVEGLQLRAVSVEQMTQEKAIGSMDNNSVDKSILVDKKLDFITDNTVEIDNVVTSFQEKDSTDIAIIGMSCRLPGANNINEFWKNLCDGVDAITEIPEDFWGKNWYHPNTKNEGTSYSKWGGFISDADKFDPLFFGISPREAETMDPQQRLFLEESWKAIEDAGYTLAKLDRKKVGVFVGAGTGDYLKLMQQHGMEKDGGAFTGNSQAILAARISYFMNFTGPALAIDTACSSSLVAIERACKNILSGETEMAIAGGVALMNTPISHILTSQVGMPSKDGKCKTFDDSADGIVPGEGVGVIVLKKLTEAEKDGDNIYAVIKGSGINQDGRTNGITAPSERSQTELQLDIYKQYSIDPSTISYVEAHGTGTKLGDPIELDALTNSFKKYTDKKQYCAIGSVKTNIGHTGFAAGAASVIKTVLMLKNKKCVPSLHYQKANTEMDIANSPFYVNTEFRDWKSETTEPLRAAISSFGFSGTNAHLVLEAYQPKQEPAYNSAMPAIILLSAKNEGRLKAQVENLKEYIVENRAINLYDIAYTLQTCREPMDERLSFSAETKDELITKLSAYLAGEKLDFFVGNIRKNKSLISTEDKNDGVETAFRNKDAKTLAQLWAKGLNIDWNLLYPTQHPRKISLPTYAFAKERYWVSMQSGALENATTSVLHPLLHGNESDLTEQKFSSIYTGSETFLAHHKVREQKVLPGVAYLELAREAGERSLHKPITSIKNVTWLSPVVVNEIPEKVDIHIYPVGEEINYEVTSIQQDEEKLHSKGTLGTNAVEAANCVDINAIRERLTNSKVGIECYQLFQEQGLNYGTSFQGIQTIYYSDVEALSEIYLPKMDGFILSPGLLDSALQTCIGLGFNAGKANLELPFSVREVTIYNTLPEKTWCYARKNNRSKSNRNISAYDIDLLDSEGQVLLSFRDFVTLPLDGFTKTKQSKEDANVQLFNSAWRKKEIAQEGKVPTNSTQLILIAGGNAELADKLKEALEIEVEAINGETATAYFTQVFEKVKQVLQTKATTNISIIYKNDDYLEYNFITGLLKSVARENSKFSGKVIGVEGFSIYDFDTLVTIIEAEQNTSETEIRYRNRNREVKTLEAEYLKVKSPEGTTSTSIGQRPMFKTNYETNPIKIKENGVYLITGGAGGLGLLFANYISQTKGAKLILTGRSEANDDIKNKLSKLPNASYYQCDVSNKEEVVGLMKTIQQNHQQLAGVIHSAGILRDSFIVKKTAQEINEVLSPKIIGTKNLDEATKNEPLDFFVLFSSLAAVIGNIGQADYASANAYLNNYAEFRDSEKNQGLRQGKTLSINWPLWKDGGMQINAETEVYLKKQMGMLPLPTKDGITAFEELLNSANTQGIVVFGDEKASQVLLGKEKENVEKIISDKEKTSRATIEMILIEVCSAVLKLNKEDFELDVEFAQYGVDSIMMMKIMNQLEARFDMVMDPTAIVNYPTIALLAGYLEEEKLLANKGNDEPALPTIETEKPQETIGQPERKRFASIETKHNKVAIIGMSCKLPGADNLVEYWENLQSGKDLISDIPADRWNAADYFSATPALDKAYTTKGGFINGAGFFDTEYFKISEADAISMDPQQRIVLELTRALLANAGYKKEEFSGTKTGVYIGAKDNNYVRNNYHFLPAGTHQHTIVNNISNMIAARVSDFYNLKGPSLAIDTACSSSMVAIHQACDDILNNKIATAIAGGISIMIDAFGHIGFSQAEVLSKDGKSYVFDQRADGFVMSEGGGLVLLKDYEKAVEDSDQIFGVIIGSAVNNDGKTMGLTVPNKDGQKEVISNALQQAGISPQKITYYEAHGTGTLLGDPIEIKAATEVYRNTTNDKQYCAIGSVKSNFGHTMTAAGVTGLIKILLQMQHNKLVPTLHCENPHPRFKFEESPFYPNTILKNWDAEEKFAAISSFGFGGTNCHLIIEKPSTDISCTIKKQLPVERLSNNYYWLGQKASTQSKVAIKSLTQTISYNEPLMRNHQIFGKQVLMGLTYISLSIDEARKAYPNQPFAINKILFSNPLVLEIGESATLKSSFNSATNKLETAYEKAGQVTKSSTADLKLLGVFEIENVDINTLKATSIGSLEGSAFYNHNNQTCYGPALKTVQNVWYLADKKLLAQLHLQKEILANPIDFVIHPALFDGAHVATSLCLNQNIETALTNHWPPLMVKSVEVSGNLSTDNSQDFYCIVTPIKNNDAIAEFNISLMTNQGTPIVKLLGFVTKSVPNAESLFGSAKTNAQEITTSNDTKIQIVPIINSTRLTEKQLRESVQNFLKMKVGELLGSDAANISLTQNFMDMGLDSSQMINISQKLETELGVELYPTLFFEYQNIADLAGYFLEDHAKKINEKFAVKEDISPVENDWNKAIRTENQTSTEKFFSTVAPLNFTTGKTDTIEKPAVKEDIAIVGMSGYLPKSADLTEFWQHIQSGKDLIEEIPLDHWDYKPWFSEDKKANNKTYSKWGGFLKDIDKFDPMFFGVAPRQAVWMDPQVRLLLQSAYHTFEDAGVINTIRGTRTGVYVGSCFHEYWDEIVRSNMPMTDYQHNSSAMSSLSGTISYHFDLQGASIPLDNACASSMTALHLACQAIGNGEIDNALIGGLNVLLSPLHYVYFSRMEALSPTGRCHTFDKKADGYVPGEGVVSIMIKPLSKAINDGNKIHGVIRGSAINHVGRSNNPSAPRPELQTKLLEEAWKAAGIHPEELSYLEAHGTGTGLGDPIEINAVKRAFKKFTNKEDFCFIGSTKAHAGHLEGAAGLTSIIKVLLMMKHKTIPHMPNFEELNPYIKLDGSPLKINTKNEVWQSSKPLIAGVSSFGMTGNNAHFVIEEYQPAHQPAFKNASPAVIILSARTADALKTSAKNLQIFLESNPDKKLYDIAYTLQMDREAMEHRLAFTAADEYEISQKLSHYLDGNIENTAENIFYGTTKKVIDNDEHENIAIENAMENKESNKLAAAWVKGLKIDWTKIYGHEKPAKLSLPNYPFAKERYWFDLSVNHKNASSVVEPKVSQPIEEMKILDKVEDIPQSKEAANQPEGKIILSDLTTENNAAPVYIHQQKANPIMPQQIIETTKIESPIDYSNTIDALKNLVKDALYITEDIDEDKTFLDLGLDSITGVELVKSVNTQFGIKVEVTKLYDYPTIKTLAIYIVGLQTSNSTFVIKNIENELVIDLIETKSEAQILAPIEVENLRIEPTIVKTPLSEIKPEPLVPVIEKLKTDDRIAIVGMSGRYPKSENLGAYWNNISAGTDCVEEVPAERWDTNEFYKKGGEKTGDIYSKWLGGITDIDKFDPLFFNMTPAEAELMDPQHRIFLQECWKSLEDAGYTRTQLDGKNCGTYVGIMVNEYGDLLRQSGSTINSAQFMTGNSISIFAARLAYMLNLKGPAIAMDTACSSSLVCIHLACQALRNHEIDMALAGGVTLYLGVEPYKQMCAAGMLSLDGACKTFDNSADGFVPGEGAGVVVLKRLADAIKDGDKIKGVILGSGINQDGKTNGITAPSVISQTALLKDIYTKYAIDPSTISYVEAHGTGTKIGDPIEVEALTTAFRSFTERQRFCGLGSVKSNLGHTSAASGVAGLHKILLQMQHGKLAPTIHFNQENEHLHLSESPFFINKNLTEWKKENGQPRRAALSSFGFSGTNAHLVVEEFVPSTATIYTDTNPALVVLSAKNLDRLKEQATNLIDFLATNETANIYNIAYTLQTAREAMEERLALVVKDNAGLVFQLTNYLQGNISKAFTGNAKKDKPDFTLKGGAGKAYINYAIENREIESLAQLWVKGTNFDWNLLYPINKPNKISLPTYPFEKRRCWFTVAETVVPVKTISRKVDDASGNKAAEFYALGVDIASSDFQEEYLSFAPFEQRIPSFSMTKVFIHPEKFPAEKAFITAKQMKLRQVLFYKEDFKTIKKVFDFGCGHGTDVIQIAKQNPHIQTIGFTITKSQADLGNGRIQREGLEKQAQIFHKDSSIDTMPANCDLIVGVEVSCHISNKKGLFQNIENAVAENGRVLLMDFIANMRGSIVDPAVEIYISTAEEWVNILSAHHLVIDEIIDVSPQISNFMYDPEFETHIKDLPKVAKDSFRNYVNCSSSLEKGWISYCLFKIKKDSTATEQALKIINTKKIANKIPYAVALKDMLQVGIIPYPKPVGRKVVQPLQPPFKTTNSSQKIASEASLQMFECGWKNTALEKEEMLISKTLVLSNGSSSLVVNELKNLIGEIVIISSDEFTIDYNEVNGLIDLTPLENGHDATNYEWIKPLQQLIDNSRKSRLKLLIVSTVEDIKGAERFGLYHTLRAEYAKAESLHIAIDKTESIKDLAYLIAEAYNSATAYTKLQYKNNTWQHPVLLEQKVNFTTKKAITGPVLITGGTRGIGMICAKHLVENYGVKQLVLLGKEELPNRINWQANENTVEGNKIKDIIYLESLGVEVKILATSLSDKQALATALSPIIKNWGTIKGMLHCAGYTDLKTPAFKRKTPETVAALQAVKVLALNNLHALLNNNNELDFAILCSSVSSLAPKLGVGFTDYVMANTYMDAFAANQRNEGYNYTSVQWPNWREAGMGELKGGIYEEMGLLSITNKQGMQALDAVLNNKNLPSVISPAVLNENFDAEKLLTVPKKELFKLKKQTADRLKPIYSTIAKKDVTTVEIELLELFQSVLKLEKQDLEGIDNFAELGIDSINVVELVEVVNRTFNLNLPTSVLFTFGTLEQLASYIQQELSVETLVEPDVFAGTHSEIITGFTPKQTIETINAVKKNATFNDVAAVEAKLTNLFQTILKLERQDLEGIDNFSELGIDSINVVELVEVINHTFSLNMPTSVLFTFGTMEQLAKYIAESIAQNPVIVQEVKEVFNVVETPLFTETNTKKSELVETLNNKLQNTDNKQVIYEKTISLNAENLEKDDIAIIGLSCRSAGANSKEEFWNLVKNGDDCIEDVQDKDWLSFFETHCKTKNKIRYGSITEAENFDAAFFNISSKEAELMDVTQRILLEECYKALEDAGYAPATLANQPVGTFIGAMDSIPKTDDMSHFSMLGSENSILAGRVAHFLNLKGIALTLNTACSSSVVAMDLAISKLKSGEINLGICGGITVYTHPAAFVSMSNAGMLSPTGECRPFDNEANGIVVGDGVGIVILKRLSEALKDGDHIYGVIRGVGSNQNGKTLSITVPSHLAQSELIESVYRKNDINADNIQYVESHGTATKLGDPAEIHGLTHAFSQFTDKKRFCSIGSLKANIGHTTAAAGVLGVIKVLLGFQHQQIPPSIHFTKENEHIDFDNSPVVVNTILKSWPLNEKGNRLAVVSSFGFSGNNTHLVLEEINQPKTETIGFGEPVVVVLSAKNTERLKEKATDLSDFLKANPTSNLYDTAYTLQLGRDAMEERLAFVANNVSEVRTQLTNYVNGVEADFFSGNSRKDKAELLAKSNKAFINFAMQNKDLESLAQLWVKGANIDWSLFYQGLKPKKISLPTYPFAKEKYEFDGTKKRRNTVATRNINQPIEIAAIEKQVSRTLQPIMQERMVAHSTNGKIVLADIASSSNGFTKEVYTIPALKPVQPIAVKAVAKPKKQVDKKAVLKDLKELLKEALYLENDIEEDRAFVELGLDSIIGVELMKSVNDFFGIKLEATKLYDYPTLESLSVYICEQMAESVDENNIVENEIIDTIVEKKSEAITEIPEPVDDFLDFINEKKNQINTGITETEKFMTGNKTDNELVLSELTDMLKEALYFEGEIEKDRAFVEFGLDSIIGVELTKSINQHFGLNLEAMRLYDYPTLETLAVFISEQMLVAANNNEVENYTETEMSEVFVASNVAGEISIITNEILKEETQTNNQPVKADNRIAIIGMSGRYPKSENLEAYWNNISTGKDCVEEVPENRWSTEEYYKEGGEKTGEIYSKWLGSLTDINQFDPAFFNISPAEAELMDPHHRIFMQECWKSLEDAGYTRQQLNGKNCGTYVGVVGNEYGHLIAKSGKNDNLAQFMTGNSASIFSARLAYLLNLKGPAMAVDTACSSSLVCIHLACQALWNNEIDMALAGGVSLYLGVEPYKQMCAAGMLSKDGACKTFDDSADGFVPGEGAGVVVLKRLADALKDGDEIKGVILGSGINQDGKTNGITAPSVNSQITLLKDIYTKFSIDPATISYVEAHGTGTKIGDPIEVEALSKAFRSFTDKQNFCGLGSVKSNLGHTSAAAGVAGLHKLLLQMQHGKIAPTIHFNKENEMLHLDGSPFYINNNLTDWKKTNGQPRRAALSSFGFSGTNAHLILEEFQHQNKNIYTDTKPAIIVLSAKNIDRLKEQASNLNTYLATNSATNIYDIAYTLQTGREAMNQRLAFIATNNEELTAAIKEYLEDETSEKAFTGNIRKDKIDVLLNGEQEEIFIANAIKNGDQNLITQLWVKGAIIDWSLIYKTNKPKKISLPTYPFAKESYWVAAQQKKVVAASFNQLHPLLHTNESNFQEQKYTSIYTGNELFLTDHKVGDDKILPGVAYLEMAREAGERSTRKKITQLTNISWLSPVRVNGTPQKIAISLSAKEHEFTYEVYSNNGKEQQVHNRGSLHTGVNAVPQNKDISGISGRLKNSIDGKECYRLFKEKGLNYGDSFQGIQTLYYGGSEALSKISLPAQKGFVLTPGMLDSALQTCAGLGFEKINPQLELPFSVGEVNVYKEIPETVWCYTSINNSNKSNGKLLHYDIDLMDNQGQVVLSFKDFVTLPIGGSQKATPSEIVNLEAVNKKESNVLYAPVWEKIKTTEGLSNQPSGNILLVTGNGEIEKLADFKNAFAAHNCQVTEVKELTEIANAFQIYLLQGLSKPNANLSIAQQIENQELSVFKAVKTLLASDYKDKELKITVLTGNTQKVLASDKVKETGGGIPGLIGSLAKEKPLWKIRVIDVEIEKIDKSTIANVLTTPYNKEETLVSYRKGNRYERNLYPVNLAQQKPGKLRKNGTYIILGGAGGIGKVTTEHLVKEYQANVIWLGRKPLDENISRAQDEIGALGVRPIYVSCDANDKLGMEKTANQIKADHPEINGLFHSAIVLNDMLVKNMDEADFLKSFAPKATASHHFVDAFKSEKLDFICFYSSVQSQINAPGQANYSAGCTYKDSYAYNLQQSLKVPIHIINWGFWGEIGIVSSEAYREKMQLFGIGSISTVEGMQILETVLSNNKTQVVAIKLLD